MCGAAIMMSIIFEGTREINILRYTIYISSALILDITILHIINSLIFFTLRNWDNFWFFLFLPLCEIHILLIYGINSACYISFHLSLCCYLFWQVYCHWDCIVLLVLYFFSSLGVVILYSFVALLLWSNNHLEYEFGAKYWKSQVFFRVSCLRQTY